jgi:hypothetical protein
MWGWVIGLVLFGWFQYETKPEMFWKGFNAIVVLLLGALAIFWAYSALKKFIVGTPKTPEEEAELAKEIAGKKAEQEVQRILWNAFDRQWQLHNALFVFRREASDEFSREVDHVYVGNRAIYLIETKYKSGTVNACVDAEDWEVNKTSTMRNALKQVKAAGEVLASETDLPLKLFVPVVALFSENGTTVVNGPSNVVDSSELVQLLTALEHQGINHQIDRSDVMAKLREYLTTDRAALNRHVQRAEKAKQVHLHRKIVSNISGHEN